MFYKIFKASWRLITKKIIFEILINIKNILHTIIDILFLIFVILIIASTKAIIEIKANGFMNNPITVQTKDIKHNVVPSFFCVVSVLAPQLGQVIAWSLISFPHSLHLINDII